MKYTKEKGRIALLIQKGESIKESLNELAIKENITFAHITGIGMVNNPVIGYMSKPGVYDMKTFEGEYEITTIDGNLSMLDGNPLAHIHITISDADFNVYGGHFFDGIVGGVGEIFVTPINKEVNRIKDEKDSGLKVWGFND